MPKRVLGRRQLGGGGRTNQEPQREQLASENPQLLALMYPNVHSESGRSPACSSSGCEDAKDLGNQQVCRARRKHTESLSQPQPMGWTDQAEPAPPSGTFYEVPTPRTGKGVTVHSDLCLPPQGDSTESGPQLRMCRHGGAHMQTGNTNNRLGFPCGGGRGQPI